MAVPDYQEFLAPCLHALSDGKPLSLKEIQDDVMERLSLSQEVQKERTPNGKKLRFPDRIQWCITYMAEARLIDRPRRGFAQITERGRTVLLYHPNRVDLNTLLQFPEFAEWKKRQPTPPTIPDWTTQQKSIAEQPTSLFSRSIEDNDSPVTELAEIPVDSTTYMDGRAEPVPRENVNRYEFNVLGSTGTIAIRREAELVERFTTVLEGQGHMCVRYRIRPIGEVRPLFTDVFDKTGNVLYEAKGLATRDAVRMALGQILDYARYLPTIPAKSVLLPSRPTDELVDLLHSCGVGCCFENEYRTFEYL